MRKVAHVVQPTCGRFELSFDILNGLILQRRNFDLDVIHHGSGAGGCLIISGMGLTCTI